VTLTMIKGYGGRVICDMPGCEKRLPTLRTSDDAELRASLGHEGWSRSKTAALRTSARCTNLGSKTSFVSLRPLKFSGKWRDR